ncbi:MAG: hypothetical protein QOC66_2060 [Pseudonocardiales bacterium]|jgi:hypothetical protein|nr:hypothetical protein [Pseudonocardiales bacterium]
MSRLPTPLRLWAAAGLCILPLGLVWSSRGSYRPGQHVLGSETSARVFLIFAAVVLVLAASRARTAFTRRLVRAATGGLGVVVALALAYRATLTLVCAALALALVAPLVWTAADRRRAAVFVPGRLHR